MKFDVDLQTGKITAVFSLDEAGELFSALTAAREDRPQAHEMRLWELLVDSFTTAGVFYRTRIWFDFEGVKHGDCQCGDSTFRHHWCKHLRLSDLTRVEQLSQLQVCDLAPGLVA